jgi:hypothetical protein
MFKLILLVLGLAIGFGGGVWWGQKHPDQAAKLSAEEERRFLEAQLAITEKIQSKLEQLSSNTSAKPSGASGFVSSSQSGAAAANDVKELKADAQRQSDELRKRLETVKK